jgi:hypothetical protein
VVHSAYAQWHERQLMKEFEPAEVASAGARLMEAIPVGLPGRYELALLFTLCTLRAKRDGRVPSEWRSEPPGLRRLFFFEPERA